MDDISKELSLILNIWGVNSVLSKKIDASLGAVHGIGFSEYMVLFHLHRSHGNVMRRIDLANSIGLTASGVTRIVSPMEKIGIVAKETNQRDARVSLVKLTDSGKEVYENATQTINQQSERLLEGLKPQSITAALDVLRTIGKDLYV